MKAVITWLTALALMGALSACNTVRGIGQDIEKLGSSIENAGKK